MDRSAGKVTEKSQLAFAVAGYAICSSCMLVTNKVAVHVLPAPSLVLFAQLSSAAMAVWGFGEAGLITVDKLEMKKVIAFTPVAFAFLGVIFANIKTLQYANVETFIVFRASTPLVITFCDCIFLGRALPGTRSWISLVGLLAGAIGYVMADSSVEVNGYKWVMVWYGVFCFDQVYIKHAVDSVKMESNWGRVFYCNLLASIPLIPSSYAELMSGKMEWTVNSVTALSASCLLGCGISYFAFLCRKALSATSFTVVGNCCKIATVVINYFIWDLHATPTGIAFLLVSLVSAFFYQQAPMRKSTTGHLLDAEEGGAQKQQESTGNK